jgi:hypothetical protein
MTPLTFALLNDTFAVCRLDPNASIPAWANGEASFLSITRNADELSIVCPSDWPPADVQTESGWRILKMEGPFDLALIGILAPVATALAAAQVNIFVVSTFDTDYVLVKDDKLNSALITLELAGHTVRR